MVFFVFIFILIVIAGALIAGLRYLLSQNIESASGQLESLSQEAVSKLAEAKRRVEEANQYYNDAITKAKDGAEKEKQRLIDEGIGIKQEMLDQARKQSEEMITRAKTAAEVMNHDLEKTVTAEATTLARKAILQILPGHMSEETHSHWVEDLLKNNLDGLNRINVSDDVEVIDVVSAFALKDSERNLMMSRLKQKLGRPIRLSEKVDPGLILGLRLTMGSVVVDGTLKFYIEEEIRNVQSANR